MFYMVIKEQSTIQYNTQIFESIRTLNGLTMDI